MQSLFLDIASHQGLVACVTDDAVIASIPVDHRIGDHELIPLIEKLLKDAGWQYEDLDRLACAVGPGGFTSLRVVVTYANVLADQLSIPSAGIHLSDLYFACARISNIEYRNPKTLWVHSTKKQELFVRGGSWDEPTHVLLDDFVEQVPRDIQWMGELIEEHQKIVDALGLKQAEVKPTEEILPAFLSGLKYDRDLLLPWYGRGW